MGSRNSVPDTFYFRIIIDQTKALQRATSKKKKKKKKKNEEKKKKKTKKKEKKKKKKKKKKKRVNLNLERLTIKDMKQGVMI